jgi:hypothetical protein
VCGHVTTVTGVCRHNPMRRVCPPPPGISFRSLSGGYNVQRAAGVKANPKGGLSCRGDSSPPFCRWSLAHASFGR